MNSFLHQCPDTRFPRNKITLYGKSPESQWKQIIRYKAFQKMNDRS